MMDDGSLPEGKPMEHDFKIEELEALPALAVRETAAAAEIPAKMGECFDAICRFAEERRLPFIGPPFAYYHSWSDVETVMDVGFPVAPGTAGEGRVRAMTLPGGRVVTGTHIGPYDTIVETYDAMGDWMKSRNLIPANHMWETYLTDPKAEPDPAKWVTRLFWPIV
jgi:effector-binding domain-containing protein